MSEELYDRADREGESTDAEPQSGHTPTAFKVIGELSSTDAAGVVGRSTATSGLNYGVRGTVETADTRAAGVEGEATVAGANGVVGLANVSTVAGPPFGEEAGVYGESEVDGTHGVLGANTATSGSFAEGVLGVTESAESPAISGLNNAGGVGVKSSGDLVVTGSQSVGKVGVSAYLTTDVPDFSGGTIPYDTAPWDDRDEFDSATGTVTVAMAGSYHVDANVRWGTGFSSGDAVGLRILVNGATAAETFEGVTATEGPTATVSKTLRGLGEGDVIEISAFLDASNGVDLSAGEASTYLTVSKIG